MSEGDEKSVSISLERPEEEALRLKTLAEEKYISGNLNAALNYAKRAQELHPSVNGLSEMLAAFEVLLAAAPISESSSTTRDYYGILLVERFSHINLIKKQYKKLAITLHPGKNRSAVLVEAFKLVGEAARVLSDKMRRREYDMRLRTAVLSKEAEEVGLLCSGCRLLHALDRKYMGLYNLICPRCKAMEKNVGVGEGQTRVSARIRERVARGVQFGSGVKRKISSVGEVSEENVGRATKVVESGVGDKQGAMSELRSGRDGAEKGGGVEMLEDGEEETMTLSQMRVLVKKKKLDEVKSPRNEKQVNAEKLEAKEKEVNIDKVENGREEEGEEKEMVNLREKPNRRSSKKGNLEVKKDGKGKGKKIKGTRETRERLRENQVEERREKGLGIMPVEDLHFYDFDKDRKARSFKKGQVWAVYDDDDDGMPRLYGLIDGIFSRNPFRVTFIWLRFLSNKDEELLSWPNTGFHVSCGIFQLSRKVTVNIKTPFSHVVDCERASNELYRIYPKEGSVWAMYNNSAPQPERIDQMVRDTSSYDIVVCLSSYSDVHGLRIGYLEKVPRFRTVFKRREVGANAVIYLGPKDVKLLSHQIPAKKLSGEESSYLPKEDCWELDPALLTPSCLLHHN